VGKNVRTCGKDWCMILRIGRDELVEKLLLVTGREFEIKSLVTELHKRVETDKIYLGCLWQNMHIDRN